MCLAFIVCSSHMIWRDRLLKSWHHGTMRLLRVSGVVSSWLLQAVKRRETDSENSHNSKIWSFESHIHCSFTQYLSFLCLFDTGNGQQLSTALNWITTTALTTKQTHLTSIWASIQKIHHHCNCRIPTKSTSPAKHLDIPTDCLWTPLPTNTTCQVKHC